MLGVTCFLAHVLVLAGLQFRSEGRLLSNFLQLILGSVAVLAVLEARARSGHSFRRIWSCTVAALAAYAVGQLLFIYHDAFFQTPVCIPKISDEFFFFWITPLLAACAIDSVGWPEGFDITVALDLAQLLILSLALHLSVFADTSRWQSHGQDMEFLKWKVRIIRDALVLGWLWARAWRGKSPELRALFARLGVFFLAYSIADAVYLYAQAAWHVQPGTWFDLLWSMPRLVAIVVAFTWKRADAAEVPRADHHPRFYALLYLAPIAVPLVMLPISFHFFASSPVLWAGLVASSFVVAGARLLVTQSRQERALADRNQSDVLLYAIIEGATEAVYLKDADGHYLLMNAAGARYIGRSVDEVLGKTDRELFPTDEAAQIRKSDLEVLRKVETVSREEELTTAGSRRTFLTTKNPYHDPQGRVAGVLGISVDVTEHRALEEQLRRAQRMESIGTFSGAIAHDFNNLLTVIKGYSQVTLSEIRDSRLQANVEQIDKAADRAAALIRQLLAFSRRQLLQPRVISLNDTISNLQKMLHRLIGEDIDLVTHLAVNLWPVKADPGQIEQVLMNLAANARDAMPQGGNLILQTSNIALQEAHLNMPPGEYAVLAVSDTGMGMDAKTQSRVFEPFFTTKPAGKGTGLGLATTYGIVKQSGGYIWVESEPGMGATFKIYLPRVDEPVQLVIETTPVTSTRRKHQTILLVEDDVQLRRLAAGVLKDAGYTVLMAEDAQEAERLAARHPGPIHLLLTDVVMPGASGQEVANRLCAQRPETRVLYMSGYPGETVGLHGVLDGGINFLQKPFTPRSLIAGVKHALAAPVDAKT